MVLVRGPGRGVKGSLRVPGPPNAIKRMLLGPSIWPAADGVLITLRGEKRRPPWPTYPTERVGVVEPGWREGDGLPDAEPGAEASDSRLAAYDYALPPNLIARYADPTRDESRLMDLSGATPAHRRVTDLPALLQPGDVLVVNDTAVMRARLRLRRASGGRVEALLLAPGPGPVPALLKPGGRLRPGELLTLEAPTPELAAASLRLISRDPDGDWMVEVSPDPATVMAAVGRVPLPPYLGREDEASDAVRYQTVYAGPLGAVAAPTAGLHLSENALDILAAAGVHVARVTLHVGVGTFRNLRSEDLDRGELHEELFHVPQRTADLVAQARSEGRRVVAVGTTSARTLESAAAPGGLVREGHGSTRLFIREGYRFQVVDALLTNFHLPRSSLLMLVAAFAGRERVMAAYASAVAEGYRFFSYGDAMFVLPEADVKDSAVGGLA